MLQLGFCASSGRQATPWVFERVASKAADFAAFDRAGNGTNAQKSHAARALWELAQDSNNKVGIARAGGIAPLVAQHGQRAISAAPLLATPVPPEAGALGSGRLPRHPQEERPCRAAPCGRLGPGHPPSSKPPTPLPVSIQVALARDGTDDQKAHATGTLASLSVNDDNKVAS